MHTLSRWAAVPLVLLLCAFGPAAKSPQSDIDRAASLVRKARDTQNPDDFRQAGAAAAKALASDSQDFEAQRYQAMALLGQQDLTGALAIASKLNKRLPDDIGIWALLSAVHAAGGNYAEAERCAQWVLDLRRDSPLGFSTAARLREVHGDYDGASEFYSEALRRTPLSDAEERSWLMVQSARMLLHAKNFEGAAATLDQAEKLCQGSLQVIEQRAELALMKKEFGEAVSLLARESEESPTAEHFSAYAQALVQAGRQDEARTICAAHLPEGTCGIVR